MLVAQPQPCFVEPGCGRALRIDEGLDGKVITRLQQGQALRQRRLLDGGTAAVQHGRGRRLRRPDVRLVEGLHADLEGLTIAQVSDMHVGPTVGRATVEAVVDEVEALGAELIAVTGDLVDGRVDELSDVVAPLARLKAPLGVYFVTGNHEYYWNARAWTEHVASLGLDVLVGEHRVLARGAARMALAGVPDIHAQHFVAEQDPWTWFKRVIAERRRREADPIVDTISDCLSLAHQAPADDADLAATRERLERLVEFMRLFCRAIDLFLALDREAFVDILSAIGEPTPAHP